MASSSCLVLFLILHAIFINVSCTAGFGVGDMSAILPTPAPSTVVDDGTWSTSTTESPLITWQAMTIPNGIDRYEVAIGTTAGGTDVVGWTGNGRSLSRRFLNLSLVDGTKYYASVRVVDTKSVASVASKGDGWTVDSTAPVLPSTFDDGVYATSLVLSPLISWSASTDSGSGLSKYEVALGTTPGAFDVVGWSNIGLPTVLTYTFTGLTGLLEGKTYYPSLRVADVAGNVSTLRIGNGWTINNTLSVTTNSFAAPLDTIHAIHDGGGSGASQKRLVGGQFTVARSSASKMNGIGRVLTADGTRDPSFTSGVGFNGDVTTTIALNNGIHAGKILVGGKFSRYNLSAANRLVRLHADGTLDFTFSASSTSAWDDVTAMAVQADGKIIVAGQLTVMGMPTYKLVRLNADGSSDTTFTLAGTGLDNRVRAIAIQATGEIVVGGDFVSFNGLSRTNVIRFTSTGAVDGSFTTPTISGPPSGSVYSISILSGNSMLIAGAFTSVNGTTTQRIAKLSSSGSLDATFVSEMAFNDVVRAMVVLSNGKILVGGDFTLHNAATREGLALLEANGALSADLVPLGFDDKVHALLVQSDGKIVVGGEFTDYGGVQQEGITRLLANGTRDSDFDEIGEKLKPRRATNSDPVIIRSLGIRTSDGAVFFAGSFASHDSAFNGLVRLDSTGVIDSTFNTGGVGLEISTLGEAPEVRALLRVSSGTILVGGKFTSYNGTTIRSGLAALNDDGTVNTTGGFGQGMCGSGGFHKGGTNAAAAAAAVVHGIALQPVSGKYIVVGDFDSYCNPVDGIHANFKNVIRLNADGTPDTSFNTGVSLNPSAAVYAVAVNSADEIFIGGDFVSMVPASPDSSRVAKLGANGVRDPTFDTNGGFDDSVLSLALNPSGHLIAGGSFTGYDGVPSSRIALLDKDSGALDSAFTTATGGGFGGALSATVRALYVQADGKIVAAGDFEQFAGATRGRIARLLSTGAIDTSAFVVGASTTEATSSIRALYPFGQALAVGGSFAVINGGAAPGNPIPSPGYAEVKSVLP